MRRDIPRFLRTHVHPRAGGVYADLEIHGMPFFWANSSALFEVMVGLARQGTTMYDHSVYEPKPPS
jgi:hypothetical protein